MPAPLIVINAVGLTPRLVPLAPRLQGLAKAGRIVPLRATLPAVTCTAQATMLTGTKPERHGVVANGWLYRDTGEVRFWQQSNRLIQAEPIYATARRAQARGRPFKCAKLFWWFNQGAQVDISVTPKPHYAIDGNKEFGIHGTPEGLSDRLEERFGPFPFATFWGPMAGLPSTTWIAATSGEIIRTERPDLTLVYLPHLDYDPQRIGPDGCDWPRLVGELDAACQPILEAAKAMGRARVWVVSEYGHCQVDRPVYLNRVLRKAGLLAVRLGPFGEQLDTLNSRALAVCDHQLAHIYVNNADDLPHARDLVAQTPGVARVCTGDERAEIGLHHERSGELIALAEPRSWFAYPFWLDDALAPDYARCVAIHHKPGYDPCELFLDPPAWRSKLCVARRLLQKKLGFRMRMDVVPLDATMVKGSHGLLSPETDGPLWIVDDATMAPTTQPMTAVRDGLLTALGLGDE